MMKKYLILFFISSCAINVMAQDPNWSVDPHDYQYSMTFTAFLNVNGTTLTLPADKVAAFVDGEVRGVGTVTYVPIVNKYLAYFFVYANTAGETINFKIYDSSSDSPDSPDSSGSVFETDASETFVINGIVGGVFQSYSIASPALSGEAILNSFNFSGIASVSEEISSDMVTIVLPENTDLTSLTAVFDASENSKVFIARVLQESGISAHDFTNPIVYQVLSENEATLVEYEVNVTLEEANIDAPELILTSSVSTFVKQAPIIVNMQTNVPISNFVAQDVVLTNAFVLSITKENDLLYTLEIVPIQQGAFSIEIPANMVFNAQNEGNLASNKLTFTYDLVNPYLVSIKRKNPTVEITDSDMLEFTVLFSEDVENVLSTDFESVPDATFTVVKENDSTYTVTVNTIDTFVGTASLNLKSTNTIQDKAGNLLLNSVINVHQN